MEGPDRIGPDHSPKRTLRDRARRVVKTWTTKEGLVGDYNYAYLFTPRIPFTKHVRKTAPFFGLHDRLPVLLAFILGLQHALAMLAGVISPPIILGGSSGANFGDEEYQYLVSTSLIVSGLLSAVQMTRFRLWKTRFFIGTGLISVVGTSFSTITVASGTFSQMYASGYCPVDGEGNRLPCPKGYGAILGTACLCSLLEIGLSFMSPRILKRIFPPLVTGPTVLLIGASLISSGMKDWAGGSGSCGFDPSARALCPSANAPHALPWGSAEFIGLGFLVFVTIILCERFGSPIMKSCAVVIGLLVGCIVAAACGYFDRSGIDAAPVASFIWLKTFPLTIYAPLILPFLALYIVIMMESIGDITATCDVSQLEVEGAEFDSRIQGGVLGNGLTCLFAGLCTITPMSVFAQNNGVIALTKCANRKAGYCCCFFLVVMGVFAKFAAAIVAIPKPVLGGMTTFLFSSVAISGIRIISTIPFTRRNRFILTAAFAVGMAATLVPDWFSYFFTYSGDNHALQGLLNAVDLVMENGFAITAVIGLILNLILPEDPEDEAAVVEATETQTPTEAIKGASEPFPYKAEQLPGPSRV
ncbi:nucleobase:cation symporter-2 family protein [Aspergillus clavatus NRRL 1]|uniref:Purine permease, putative n=1 Tax=Aspergillus clavatus (strain ATCC 1007 / CBS 513.65 / DSM 816 / NCTC 3887 / NRRL 1 / QM 1276 / 107) TaxID=344612 RepID=A1CDS4_ASPCL|nr:purine permease, putative [Aspergillus clavatus NRRL 1]EAW12001.1 purine permease, putative [Aspergillus clavatus NRRL 1]